MRHTSASQISLYSMMQPKETTLYMAITCDKGVLLKPFQRPVLDQAGIHLKTTFHVKQLELGEPVLHTLNENGGP